MEAESVMSYSKKDEKKISKYINKWQKKLSLGDWDINWCIAGFHDSCVTEKRIGEVQYILNGHVATIYIHPLCEWPRIKETIRHELLHVVLADYRKICDKHMPEDIIPQFEAYEHAVINRINPLLEN